MGRRESRDPRLARQMNPEVIWIGSAERLIRKQAVLVGFILIGGLILKPPRAF